MNSLLITLVLLLPMQGAPARETPAEKSAVQMFLVHLTKAEDILDQIRSLLEPGPLHTQAGNQESKEVEEIKAELKRIKKLPLFFNSTGDRPMPPKSPK